MELKIGDGSSTDEMEEPIADVETNEIGESEVKEKDRMEVEMNPDLEVSGICEALECLPLDLFPSAHELPPRPPPANECNYAHYFAVDVGKEYHDQYIFRHANGLCVVGLAPSHAAFMTDSAVTGVDFNVGKQNRADIKAVGKRKKNARVLESNSVLCKVLAGETFFLIRCCVRGTLLEVNERLIKDPQLILSLPDTEGFIAIIMPRPEDWTKAEAGLLSREEYRKRRGIS